MTKTLKRSLIFLLVALIIVSFAGCSKLVGMLENKDVRNYTETMINAIITDDADTAYSVVSDVCDEAEFKQVFEDMKVLIGDVDSYKLTPVSVYNYSNVDKGQAGKGSRTIYTMEYDSGKLVIEVQTHSEFAKLSAFHIAPYESTGLYSTGTIGSMKGANFVQWLLLLSNILVVAFVVFAIVDCCRNKIKYKALWIIIIALGMVTLALTLSGTSINFKFNFGWIISHSAYIIYGNGAKLIRLICPVGAIIYFLFKKRLLIKDIEVVSGTVEDNQVNDLNAAQSDELQVSDGEITVSEETKPQDE